MKILLLEDDFSLNKIIKNSLEKNGFFVDEFTNGIEAITNILNSTYDIYILDINVPGFDGHKVLEIIREQKGDLPVIIISAASDIQSIQKAYTLGCNDYLKKPFDLEELFLRINYLIKTSLHQNIDDSIINIGYGYTFCIKTQKLFKFKHEITLTHKETLLLSLLVQHLNKTVNLDLIHEYVWDSKEVEAVSMRSVIHKLQKKLKNSMIVNIRGVGYKLQYNLLN
jgi:DNA-binding response OmpR family regulator